MSDPCHPSPPREIEVYSFYRKHLGPGMEAAGLRVQFHYNQKPGIHFKVQPSEEYRSALIITEGQLAAAVTALREALR